MTDDGSRSPGPEPPGELVERLSRHGQAHLLTWWAELDEPGRRQLAQECRSLDLNQIDDLVARLVRGEEGGLPDPSGIGPIEVFRLPRTDAERSAYRHSAEIGEAMLAAGEVGVVIVAGGQGTRLGFDGPKGTFPIGPVSAASLFQIHAEKVVALSKRHGKLVPLYIMTSPDNHDDTLRFFAEHDHFGLEHVRFFQQGRMPAVDRSSGKVLLADKHELAMSPDGHGGTIRALATPADDGGPSCLEEMKQRGLRTLFYFQVDNPLVKVAHPAFLGFHRRAEADVSFKVVEKVDPGERVGVVVVADGRPIVIEYSDLPADLAGRREPDGSLQLWAGSIAIHVFELTFLERLAEGSGALPFHRAFKKVSSLDEAGDRIEPAEPNAVKFERFIFDALPLAERWAIVETDRAVEFEPLKNKEGPESPASVRQRMSDLFASWLEAAGATVPRRDDGSVPFGVEISPLFALDAADLRRRLEPGLNVDRPLYLR